MPTTFNEKIKIGFGIFGWWFKLINCDGYKRYNKNRSSCNM